MDPAVLGGQQAGSRYLGPPDTSDHSAVREMYERLGSYQEMLSDAYPSSDDNTLIDHSTSVAIEAHDERDGEAGRKKP